MSAAEKTAAVIDAVCAENGWDWHAEIVAASGCCWQAKLTVVLTPDRASGPDRSLTTMAASGASPDDVLEAAWEDMGTWLTSLPRTWLRSTWPPDGAR